VPELVAHGETGYLFSPDDVDEAKHFLEIAADAERARMVGMRARQTAQAKFHLSHVVQSYIELYRTLLTERQVETRHVG
jgi:glycosyltransferase involved in cell wall biosynthesis